MIVVFIHGPAASGKHTIGSLLAERTGLPLWHNHLAVDAAAVLFPFGSEGFVRLRARLWRAAFEEAAAQRRSFIFTFHPEATVDPALVQELCGIVTAAGGRVRFVELACDRKHILERLRDAGRTRFGKLTDTELYERLEREGAFEFPRLPEPLLRVDTGTTAPERAALLIAAALRVT